MKDKRLQVFGGLLVVLAIIVLASRVVLVRNQSLKSRNAIGQTNGIAHRNVSVRLKWQHQGQFAGFYMAKENGYYDEMGINATFEPGGGDSAQDPTLTVDAGLDQFGVWGAERVLLARASGRKIKAIGVIFQDTAACFLSPKHLQITNMVGFIGRRVGVQNGTDIRTMYEAMLEMSGVDRKTIKEIPAVYSVTPLLSGQVDIWPSYSINEPFKAATEGFPVNILRPRDLGLEFYGDTIITSEGLIRTNSQLVSDFLNATSRGWIAAFADSKRAAQVCLKYNDNMTAAHHQFMIEEAKGLVRKSDVPLFWMSEERWNTIRGILRKQGLLKTEIDLDQLYSNDFINKKLRY